MLLGGKKYVVYLMLIAFQNLTFLGFCCHIAYPNNDWIITLFKKPSLQCQSMNASLNSEQLADAVFASILIKKVS